jgi:hypothetical protein
MGGEALGVVEHGAEPVELLRAGRLGVDHGEDHPIQVAVEDPVDEPSRQLADRPFLSSMMLSRVWTVL